MTLKKLFLLNLIVGRWISNAASFVDSSAGGSIPILFSANVNGELEQAVQTETVQEDVSLYECNFLPLAYTGKTDSQIDSIIRGGKK